MEGQGLTLWVTPAKNVKKLCEESEDQIAQAAISDCGLTHPDNLPYIQELVPNDTHLISNMKKYLLGNRFWDEKM